MRQAAIGISNSAAACRLAQSTTQVRYERKRLSAQGVASCSEAPASIGSVATRPATVSPVPRASANAAKYVSPMPTITLYAAASPMLHRMSPRGLARAPRAGRGGAGDGVVRRSGSRLAGGRAASASDMEGSGGAGSYNIVRAAVNGLRGDNQIADGVHSANGDSGRPQSPAITR